MRGIKKSVRCSELRAFHPIEVFLMGGFNYRTPETSLILTRWLALGKQISRPMCLSSNWLRAIVVDLTCIRIHRPWIRRTPSLEYHHGFVFMNSWMKLCDWLVGHFISEKRIIEQTLTPHLTPTLTLTLTPHPHPHPSTPRRWIGLCGNKSRFISKALRVSYIDSNEKRFKVNIDWLIHGNRWLSLHDILLTLRRSSDIS